MDLEEFESIQSTLAMENGKYNVCAMTIKNIRLQTAQFIELIERIS